MKLIIELDEKQFKDIQRIASIQIRRRSLTCEQIIANGIPLPKGHGDLIDSDVLCEKYEMTYGDLYQAFDLTPIIIEADIGE